MPLGSPGQQFIQGQEPPVSMMLVSETDFFVGGGEKGYHFGGEVAPSSVCRSA